MKNLLYFALAFISFLSSSCNHYPDFTDPTVLSGTTWRCNDFNADSVYNSTYDYFEYKFLSTDSVQSWTKKKNEDSAKKISTSYYSIHDLFITVFIDKADSTKALPTIVIGKNTLSYRINNSTSTGTITLVFYKQ
ncbi:MAG: hypothetical protein WC542_10580 [Paludibacter sp.]|jgi:hypothetical protein